MLPRKSSSVLNFYAALAARTARNARAAAAARQSGATLLCRPPPLTAQLVVGARAWPAPQLSARSLFYAAAARLAAAIARAADNAPSAAVALLPPREVAPLAAPGAPRWARPRPASRPPLACCRAGTL